MAIGGAVANFVAGNQRADANKSAALADQKFEDAQIGLREQQVQGASTQSIMLADRQARQAEALAKVSAGESGVTGVSVDMLLNDLERQKLEYEQSVTKNKTAQIDQLQAQKTALAAQTEARISQVPSSNPLAFGLQIGSSALDFGTAAYGRLKKPKTSMGVPDGS